MRSGGAVPIRDKRVVSSWAFAMLDDLLVLCARDTLEPVEADVAAWLEYAGKNPLTKMLVHSLGSMPNAAQRRRIAALFAERAHPRTLLLTHSRPARFVAEAFRWLLRQEIHSLTPERLEDGLAWLGFRGSREEVARLIAQLHRELEAGHERARVTRPSST
jgi:hypothetical protein